MKADDEERARALREHEKNRAVAAELVLPETTRKQKRVAEDLANPPKRDSGPKYTTGAERLAAREDQRKTWN